MGKAEKPIGDVDVARKDRGQSIGGLRTGVEGGGGGSRVRGNEERGVLCGEEPGGLEAEDCLI